MCTRGPLPGDKELPERDADHSSPPSVEVKNEELYSSPLSDCIVCSGTALILIVYSVKPFNKNVLFK
jgi:hypothetical protein